MNDNVKTLFSIFTDLKSIMSNEHDKYNILLNTIAKIYVDVNKLKPDGKRKSIKRKSIKRKY